MQHQSAPRSKFEAADKETLSEINRAAEAYLVAQLTAGIAADQRAMSFIGLIAASATALGTGAGVLLLGDKLTASDLALGGILVGMTGGLLRSMYLAAQSAKPGINDMILVDASTVSNDGVELRFKGSYAIRDTYDFDNDRSMFPAYDRYRKELATQFASDPFTCILRFNKDLVDAPTSGGDAKVGPLNKSLVFICFMYAIEINRCTSPLFWEAEIPFDGMARLSCLDARLTRSGQ